MLSDNKITTLKLKELHLSEVEGKENTYVSFHVHVYIVYACTCTVC